MAKTPRKWTGARSPSGLKRVRSSARRHAILEPRRSAAKTLVRAALAAVTSATPGTDAEEALRKAASALDRAAKVGAIHPNQAARRKSRLAIKVFDAQAGVGAVAGQAARTVSKAQAQKAAKARIAAGKADKAKGAQTAAGKARAALHRTTRGEAAEAPAKAPPTAAAAPAAKAAKPAAKAAKPAAKAGKPTAKAASKTTVVGATGGEAKSATKAQASKAVAAKSSAAKVEAAKPAPKKAAKR